MTISFTSAPRIHFPDRNLLRLCLKETAGQYKMKVGELTYVFVSDEELLEMNRQYLKHDYYTDIITFDHSEEEGRIEGDIFISTDRVEDNGKHLGNGVEEEYCRVISHGFLHLCGLGDKSESDAEMMRKAENDFIALFQSKKES
jgi:probable rRNA maturation factor